MKQFELKRTLFGADITAQVTVLDAGVHILIYGGTRPHIGAVSIVDLAGGCDTLQFPTHRDGTISELWADALAGAGYRPVVAEAGIHYDNLSAEQIQAVLDLSMEMLAEAQAFLKAVATTPGKQ